MSIENLLERADDFDKDVIVLTALIPPPVSLDHLVAVTSHSVVRILKLLEDMAEDGILVRSELLGKGYYYFADAASVRLVLNRADPGHVRRLAEAFSGVVERRYEEGPARDLTLTHLAQTAGIELRSLDVIVRSAEYCRNLGLKEDSAVYYHLAMQRLPRRLRSIRQQNTFIDAALGLVSAQGHLMPLSDQRILLEKALKPAERIGRQDATAKISLVLAQVLKTEGDYTKAAQYFEQGWSLARRLGNEDLLKWAALSTTEFLFWQGRVAEAVERYEHVIGNLEELPSDETTLRACASLGWCYGICGEPARGMGLIAAVRERSRKLGLKEVKVYSDLTTVLTLLESRRVEEVEPYLDEMLGLPEEMSGHYPLWAANAAMAYVHCSRGEMEEAFRRIKEAHRHSKKHGWPHHRGPWNFEMLDALEKAGMIYPEMCYESEITRCLNWPDIYMQGVGLRFRAQRAMECGGDKTDIEEDLRQSMELLATAGARLEYARTQLCTARLRLRDASYDEAKGLTDDAWKTLSRVNEADFPNDLRKYIAEKDREKLLISTVVEVGTALGTVRSRSKLLKQIINLTMRLTRAERGGFFLVDEDNELRLAASRNLDPELVDSGQARIDAETIRQVARSGKEATVIGTAGRDNDGLPADKRGWMICTPVLFQDRVVGVLYLECRLIALPFPEEDLPLLRAIGNQVSTALDNVRAYEEIARLRDRLEEETRVYKMELESSAQLGDIVGKSDAVRLLGGQIERVAPTDSSVLITGETGVGKGLVARAVHRLSPRSGGPFIPVNTSSLSEGLVASELFGHERGAFTGALTRRLGRFELAEGGSLFLDDVDHLSHDIQVRLLRALQDMEFERVGGSKTLRSDFRVIAATNQNLEALIERGQFRSDLYYRLNVFPIHIPPLRQRKEDIPLLAAHFLDFFSTKMGKKTPVIPESQMKRLTDYPWPGNVRELQHVIERAVILSDGDALKIPGMGEYGAPVDATGEFTTLEEMERSYILRVLEACDWKVSGKKGAAAVLGTKPTTLYSKIRRLGIKRNVSYRPD
ncbi:MAG: sigma 54-interacting transcriptional regulator [Pseudomonadota bacterium]